jgi:ribosome biogenesis GTPase
MSEFGELSGSVSGNYHNKTTRRADFPAVGDWVIVEPDLKQKSATIINLLPRHSMFARKTTGTKTEEQAVAANIDTVFIITGLDNNFNINRIERYVTLIWSSGARPVIILNKADMLEDAHQKEEIYQQITSVAIDLPIHFISAATGEGMLELQQYFTKGSTIAMVGSSGVGKSTLINSLLGNIQQKTVAVREKDAKGRHTTTHRQIFLLPGGGMVVDTPGMRELQLWMDEEDLNIGFSDIERLAIHCRFSDCSHSSEPGCAVQAAIDAGHLDESRLIGYKKMQRELKHLANRQQENLHHKRATERQFSKMCRNVMKHKRKK